MLVASGHILGTEACPRSMRHIVFVLLWKAEYFSPIGQEYSFLQLSGIFLSRPAVSAYDDKVIYCRIINCNFRLPQEARCVRLNY